MYYNINIISIYIMELQKELNESFDNEYYVKYNGGNEEVIKIEKNEYNKLNYMIRGGDAISLDNLEIKTFVRNVIFRHEFIYDFILPILDEYNKEIDKKIQENNKLNYNNLNMYISGNTSLVINLEEYKNNFNENEILTYYKLFEKSDVDANVIINPFDINESKNYKNIIRSITQRLLYKYKDILLKNKMFVYYIQFYIIDYLNNNENFMKMADIKFIKKNIMPNKIKYENKEFISRWSVIDDIPDNIFIRINEGLKFNDDETIDLYRLMVPYSCQLNNDRNQISIWSELIDISIKEIKMNCDDDYINKIKNKIEQILNIFYENIRLKKETSVNDIPKNNESYNIPKIIWCLSYNNTEYISKKIYNNLYINVLTLKGYIYESVLIILNTPDDPKINKRIQRTQFILSIIKKTLKK